MGLCSKISYNTLMEENQQNNTPVPPENNQAPAPQPNPFNDDPPEIVPENLDISWVAPEFIEHKKTIKWYLTLLLILVVMAVAIYFVIHSIFPIVMILLVGLAFAIVAGRSPRTITYEISNTGISVGDRFNTFSEFKSFSVIDEGNLGSIVLNPFKRFVFPTTIYYDLKDEEKIVSTLTQYLPLEEPANDPVDQLMRKLRF